MDPSSFPCVIFRHDLDEISKDEFQTLKSFCKTWDTPTTFFILEHQYSESAPIVFPKFMPDEERKEKKEEYQCFIDIQDLKECQTNKVHFALHSEAMPHTLKLNQLNSDYTANLGRQKESFYKTFGQCTGHSAHSDNATVYVDAYGNTEINRQKDSELIHNASAGNAFNWFSGIRDVVHLNLETPDFLPLQAPHLQGSCYHFPIGWDDHLCYVFRESQPLNTEQILSSLWARVLEAQEKRLPLVASFHPMRFIEGHSRYLYSEEVLLHFTEKLLQNKIPILSYDEYLNQLQINGSNV